MTPFLVITLTGILVAAACAVMGSLLVLRKLSMMSDAISHAILPGLVAGYVIANGPNLFTGFFGAVIAGLITVSIVEFLIRTKLVKQDAAIGLVFSVMFAFGTFLVTKFFSNVHLDSDAILYGNIEFSSFDTLFINNINLGPQSLWIMGGVLLLNCVFVYLLYKEIKLSTFDPQLSTALGFSSSLIYYLLMMVVTITTVAAFTAVGAILTVALIIVPAVTAYLLTNRFNMLIFYAVTVGIIAAIFGNLSAQWFDVSVSGSMAAMSGVLFIGALLFSPLHGIIVTENKRTKLRKEFALRALVVHLFHHEQSENVLNENSVQNILKHFQWDIRFAQSVLKMAQHERLLERKDNSLMLTDYGRNFAKELITQITQNKGFRYI